MKIENQKTRIRIHNYVSWIFLILFCVIISIIVTILLNGNTTITGVFQGNTVTDTLVCESDQVAYSIFAFDGSASKNLRINAIFEDNQLNSVSLMYKLNYNDQETLSFSEARNHVEVNESFKNDGLNYDALNAKYGIMSDGIQFSIYAKDNNINEKTLKYFMISSIYDISKIDIEKMSKSYNDKGLNCIIKYSTKEEVNETK